MQTARLVAAFSAVVLSGCAGLNPLASTELTDGFSDRVIEVNQAYRSERNAQVLVNILRARDRLDRKYTSLSELKLAPSGKNSTTYKATDLGLGNNLPDPWISLGADRAIENSSNLELAISPNARGPNALSVYRSPITAEQFSYYWTTDWPKDLIEQLLISGATPLVLPSGNPANGKVLDELLKPGLAPYRVFSANGKLIHCFVLTNCELKQPAPPKKKDAKKKDGKAKPEADDEGDEDKVELHQFVGNDNLLTADTVPLADRKKISPFSSLLPSADARAPEGDMRIVFCRQEGVAMPLTLPKAKGQKETVTAPHDVYRCSTQPLPSAVCAKLDKDGKCEELKSLPVSAFLVTRKGSYSISLNSIDDMIYQVGASLRRYSGEAPSPLDGAVSCPAGMAVCAREPITFSNTSSQAKLPLFSFATARSLTDANLAACAGRFSAAVMYTDGKSISPARLNPLLRGRKGRTGIHATSMINRERF